MCHCIPLCCHVDRVKARLEGNTSESNFLFSHFCLAGHWGLIVAEVCSVSVDARAKTEANERARFVRDDPKA